MDTILRILNTWYRLHVIWLYDLFRETLHSLLPSWFDPPGEEMKTCVNIVLHHGWIVFEKLILKRIIKIPNKKLSIQLISKTILVHKIVKKVVRHGSSCCVPRFLPDLHHTNTTFSKFFNISLSVKFSIGTVYYCIENKKYFNPAVVAWR